MAKEYKEIYIKQMVSTIVTTKEWAWLVATAMLAGITMINDLVTGMILGAYVGWFWLMTKQRVADSKNLITIMRELGYHVALSRKLNLVLKDVKDGDYLVPEHRREAFDSIITSMDEELSRTTTKVEPVR